MKKCKVIKEYLEKNSDILIDSVMLQDKFGFKCTAIVNYFVKLGILEYAGVRRNIFKVMQYKINLDCIEHPKKIQYRKRSVYKPLKSDAEFDRGLDNIILGWGKP
jgi:hypothetical protein